MTPRTVEVRIGELELDGIDPRHRDAVARGLETELGRMLHEHGVPPRLMAADGGVPPVVRTAGLEPIDVGRAIARALYEGWR